MKTLLCLLSLFLSAFPRAGGPEEINEAGLSSYRRNLSVLVGRPILPYDMEVVVAAIDMGRSEERIVSALKSNHDNAMLLPSLSDSKKSPSWGKVLFSSLPLSGLPIPSKIDFRKLHLCGPVLNQGEVGDCECNAVASAVMVSQRRQGLPVFLPSRTFIYYNARVFQTEVGEGQVADQQDTGTSTVDLIRVGIEWGFPPETSWTYDIANPSQIPTNLDIRPPESVYQAGRAHTFQALQWIDINDLGCISTLKSLLSSRYSVVMGFMVPWSWYKLSPAYFSLPTVPDTTVGGHGVLLVGYDDNLVNPIAPELKGHFIIQNSWDSTSGDEGYFYMPYAFVTPANIINLCAIGDVS